MTFTAARTRAVLLGVFGALTALYLVEAWAHRSPWIFFDELDYAWSSRAVADLGTKPGAKPWSFEGLYPFLIAPAWVGDVGAGYFAAKAIGAVVMTAAVFPAYCLARSLAASRPAALFAAAATVAVPAMSYSSTLMTETLAYPYATLCFFFFVRAIRSRGWLVAAAVAALLAPVVRKELAVVPAALGAAALLFLVVPRLGRSRQRWAAAIGLAVAVLALLAWALTHLSTTWSEAIAHPIRLVTYARSGAGALVVGTAILPAIAGLAALVRPRGEALSPERRAFACLFAAVAAGLLLYTAAKGAYFGPLANPVEERNLIYLVPLLFAGTAVWLTRRRVDLSALAAATALVVWLVATVPLHLSPIVPASDAPSLEVLFSIGWGPAGLHALLAGVCVVTVTVVLAVSRSGWAVAVAACSLVLVWALASQVYASRRSADYARILAEPLQRPFDWVDRATHERPAIYIGQKILQPSDILLMAFWNRSLVEMRSLDATPRAPRYHGIGSTGDILRIEPARDGVLPTDSDIRFLVADGGISGSGPLLARSERWRVYAGTRLRSAALGVYSDDWMGNMSTYRVFNGALEEVRVALSRTAACGVPMPASATFRIGGAVRRRATIPACKAVSSTIAVPQPPFDLTVSVHPTFVPAKLDPANSTDARQLGAQIEFSPAYTH